MLKLLYLEEQMHQHLLPAPKSPLLYMELSCVHVQQIIELISTQVLTNHENKTSKKYTVHTKRFQSTIHTSENGLASPTKQTFPQFSTPLQCSLSLPRTKSWNLVTEHLYLFSCCHILLGMKQRMYLIGQISFHTEVFLGTVEDIGSATVAFLHNFDKEDQLMRTYRLQFHFCHGSHFLATIAASKKLHLDFFMGKHEFPRPFDFILHQP